MIVRIPWAARWDALDAADADESKVPDLGQRFLSAVEDEVKKIAAHPRGYASAPRTPAGREVRFRNVNRFPYVIYFEITSTQVIILAIVHAKRRQRVWRAKL